MVPDADVVVIGMELGPMLGSHLIGLEPGLQVGSHHVWLQYGYCLGSGCIRHGAGALAGPSPEWLLAGVSGGL